MTAQTMHIGPVELGVTRRGEGAPLLLLHGEDGTLFLEPLVEALARDFEVLVPDHPGWGTTARPPSVKTIRDIADVYVELLETLGTSVTVVGVSLGGWIAAEMASTVTRRIDSLVLVSPIGIKVGDRESRDFQDLYLLERPARAAALYADPSRAPQLADLTDDLLLELAKAEEAVTRHCWSPYMHDPGLVHRLRRVAVRALVVAGERDRFVLAPGYYDRYASLVSSASGPVVVPDAGHRVEEEQPDRLARIISEFASQGTPAGRRATDVREASGV